MTERPANDVTASRPNAAAKWVCGYQRIGLACAEGPDEKGVCCQLRKTDRAGVARKSICQDDCSCSHTCELTNLKRAPQLPSHEKLGACVPVRATWFSRRVLTVNLAIFTAGALLLCMVVPQREAIFVPGGLSQKHAQILGNHLVSERCSLCHPNSHTDVTATVLQDELCMKCHATHLPNAGLRSPHDLTTAQLVSLTQAKPPAAGQAESQSAATNCAMCHVEHHGDGFRLAALSDSSCQACHQRKFESLAAGHPQFEGFPYRTQRRLAFDHSTHETKHFGTKNERFDCSRCHVDHQQKGAVGSVFRSVGFEKACASCHAESIKATTVNGWVLLQLPSVASEDTNSTQFELRDWPATAQFGREGDISVSMRLLLAADADVRAALAKLPANGKIQDIDNRHHERADVTQALAAGVRKLITEVAVDGQTAWKRRLNVTAQLLLERELTAHEMFLIEQMSNGLPPDLFRQMESRWFGNQEAIASKSPPPVRLVSQLQEPALLLEDEPSELDGGLFVEDADALLGNSLDETSKSARKGKLTSIKGSTHVAAGGWYLDQELLALRYMPQGHADKTLAAWAELINILDANKSAGSHGLGTLTRGEALPGACTQCHVLSSQTSTLDEFASWSGNKRPLSARLFTKFDHTPHLTLPSLSDCRHCHVRNVERTRHLAQVLAEHANSQADRQSEIQAVRQCLETEFSMMKLEQCSACHRPGAANDGCTQCHNYHVGTQGFEWSR